MRWWRRSAKGGGEDHGHAVLVHEEDDKQCIPLRPGKRAKMGWWWWAEARRVGPPGEKGRESQGEEGYGPGRDGLVRVRLEGGFLFKSFSLFLFKPVFKNCFETCISKV
jgi:hypothetical protein